MVLLSGRKSRGFINCSDQKVIKSLKSFYLKDISTLFQILEWASMSPRQAGNAFNMGCVREKIKRLYGYNLVLVFEK